MEDSINHEGKISSRNGPPTTSSPAPRKSAPRKRKALEVDDTLFTAESTKPKRARLTRANLQVHTSEMRPRKTPTGEPSSSKVTTTEKDFAPALYKNNIYPYHYPRTQEPTDLEAFRQYLDRDRDTPSPDQCAYDNYKKLMQDDMNEATVMGNPWLELRKAPQYPYRHIMNNAWTEADNELMAGISVPRPDLASCDDIVNYPGQAVEDLGSELRPSQYLHAMPCFCVEFKSTEASMHVAEQQCAYDGAMMTRGVNAATSVMKRSLRDSEGKIQAITAAFNGYMLKIYTHHSTPTQPPASSNQNPEESTPERQDYFQYLAASCTPSNSLEQYKAAYKSLRNAQDYAEALAEKRKDDLTTWYATKSPALHKSVQLGPEASSASASAELVSIASPWTYDSQRQMWRHLAADGVEEFRLVQPGPRPMAPPPQPAGGRATSGSSPRGGRGKGRTS